MHFRYNSRTQRQHRFVILDFYFDMQSMRWTKMLFSSKFNRQYLLWPPTSMLFRNFSSSCQLLRNFLVKQFILSTNTDMDLPYLVCSKTDVYNIKKKCAQYQIFKFIYVREREGRVLNLLICFEISSFGDIVMNCMNIGNSMIIVQKFHKYYFTQTFSCASFTFRVTQIPWNALEN